MAERSARGARWGRRTSNRARPRARAVPRGGFSLPRARARARRAPSVRGPPMRRDQPRVLHAQTSFFQTLLAKETAQQNASATLGNCPWRHSSKNRPSTTFACRVLRDNSRHRRTPPSARRARPAGTQTPPVYRYASRVEQGVLLVADKRCANNAVRAAFHPTIKASATGARRDILPKGMETHGVPPAKTGNAR